MKRPITMMLMVLAIAGSITASAPNKGAQNGQEKVDAVRRYQILVTNENSVKNINNFNEQVRSLQNISAAEAKRGLGLDILNSVTSAFTQKTVSASQGVVGMGISYLANAIKGDREKWYKTAEQHCTYSHTLSAESSIDDFYALPSTKGAMDPENLKFNGFGCKSFIELKDKPGEGIDVFYVYCKMRRDPDVGIKHIVNHSKFMVELDTLYFNPRFCNLPNDSTGSVESRFDFEKRKDLTFQIKVRIYSSWMNQATMILQDQQLGEFTITARIDKSKLNSDGIYVYDKNDPDFKKLVSVEGDCFIVPRSFTGTTDATNYRAAWGTGQYRVDMEVNETCKIIDDYYCKPGDKSTDPDKRKWDKNKWKPEWKEMKAHRKNIEEQKNAWDCIVDAYRGTGWVATLTEPMTTVIYKYESNKLGEMFNSLQPK